MDVIERSPAETKWTEAMRHMRSALNMLDEIGAPGDIGSYIDLAICRLEEALGCNPADNSVDLLGEHIENAMTDLSSRETVSDRLFWPSRLETA